MINNDEKLKYLKCADVFIYVTVKEEKLYIDKCIKLFSLKALLLVIIIFSLLSVVTNKHEMGWVYNVQ